MPFRDVFEIRKCTKTVLVIQILLAVALVLNLSFVWYNSSKVSKESDKTSKILAEDIAQKTVRDYNKLPKPAKKRHIDKWNVIVRSLGHFLEFVPLGFIYLLFLISLFVLKGKSFTIIILKYLAMVIFLSMLTALGDEIHQLFVKGRTFQWQDILVDTIGSLCGCLIGFIPISFVKKKIF